MAVPTSCAEFRAIGCRHAVDICLALDPSSFVDHPLLITLSMTPHRAPVPEPVTFEFENGIKLTVPINPDTKKHSVTSDHWFYH